MKVLVKLVLLFSVLVILFGFYELKHEQDIFAQSRAYCCNNGLCLYPALCSSPSSMELKPDCKTYVLTCRDCVDYSATSQVCDDPKNSCKKWNGNCYGWCYINGTWQWTPSEK